MTASTLHLTVEQGATFSQTIAVGATYSGYTARAKIRGCGFLGAELVSFTCANVTSGGDCVISLTAAQTALLLAPVWAAVDERLAQIGVWDLELVSGSTVIRAAQGVVKLSREATYD